MTLYRSIAAAALLAGIAACSDAPSGVATRVLPTQVPALAVTGGPNTGDGRSWEGQLYICKDGSGPSTSFDFDYAIVPVAGGAPVASGTVSVPLGTCVMAASVSTAATATRFYASVTEHTPPANWALSSISRLYNYSWVVDTASTNVGTRTISNLRMSNDIGVMVTFTNTYTPPPPPPPPSLEGRMTGGGAQIFGDVKITRGFTLHCDIVLSNNLEINWGKNKWHIDKPLTKATCLDDPAYREQPPVAPFNTFIGEGIGRLNGVDGSKVYFTFIDAGEPGKNDKAAIRIIAPDGVTVVLDVPLSLLDNGNIQAHYDQPHGQKP